MFEFVDRRQTTDDDNRAYSYYKLTSEPKAQGRLKSTIWLFFHTKAKVTEFDLGVK